MVEAPAQFCVCIIDCYLCFCLKKLCSLGAAGDPLNREAFIPLPEIMQDFSETTETYSKFWWLT
jgi:hypothetical protein